MWFRLFHSSGVVALVVAQLTTTPAVLDETSPHHNGRRALKKRVDSCDDSYFFCPTGTCFTALDGYIGCCTTTSCVPRTNCIPYNPTITSPCDSNTGGCLYCSQSATPSCFTITNVLASQYIIYCDSKSSSETTVTYKNPVTTGSLYIANAGTTTSASSSTTQTSTSTTPSSISTSGSSSSSTAVAASTSGSSVGQAGLDTTSTAASPTTSSGSTSLGGGAIGGIVAGAVVGIAAFAVGLWFLFRKRREQKPYAPVVLSEKYDSPDSSTAPGGTTEYPAEAEGSTPKTVSAFSPEHISQRHEADSSVVSEVPGSIPPQGLGIAKSRPQDSAGRLGNSHLEEPAKRQSYLVSPLLTQDGLSSASGSPPSLTKTPPSRMQEVAHSPSIYSREPPGSVPQAGSSRPPSMPQPYSTASMTSNAPWQYLSPEDAMSGGWVNPPEKNG